MEKALPAIALIVGLIAGVLGTLAYVSAQDSAEQLATLAQTQAQLALNDKERSDHEARIGKLEKELNGMRDELATMRGEVTRFKRQLEGGGMVPSAPGGGFDPDQAQRLLESLGGAGGIGGGGGPMGGAGGMPDLSKLLQAFPGGRPPSLKGMNFKDMQQFQEKAQEQLQQMMEQRRRALPQGGDTYD